jgi:hypothetical protein
MEEIEWESKKDQWHYDIAWDASVLVPIEFNSSDQDFKIVRNFIGRSGIKAIDTLERKALPDGRRSAYGPGSGAEWGSVRWRGKTANCGCGDRPVNGGSAISEGTRRRRRRRKRRRGEEFKARLGEQRPGIRARLSWVGWQAAVFSPAILPEKVRDVCAVTSFFTRMPLLLA